MPPQNKFYQALLQCDSKDESERLNRCRLCFQDVHQHEDIVHYLRKEALLCGDCREKLAPLCRTTSFHGLTIHLLYRYNEFLENMIYQYKESKDIALAQVFFHEIMRELNDYFRHYTIVLMPSSKEKMLERGFLPVKEMLNACHLDMLEPFYKNKDHKQSLQSYENRALISRVIQKKDDFRLPSTPLLLVDDVCTSGSTILCAYQMLLPHTYKIEALVLAAHPLFVESCDEKGLLKKSRFSIL